MRTAIRVWFAFVFVLVLTACSEDSDSSGNNISDNLIAGNITPAIGGVVLTLSRDDNEQTARSDENGHFEFNNLENGTYTLTPVSADYTFSPASISLTIENEDITDVVFAASSVSSGVGAGGNNSVSGNVTINAAPLPRVTILLESDTESLSVITDSGGNYSFTGLPNNVYTLTPSLTGFRFTPNSATFNLNNFNASGFNFIATALNAPPVPDTFVISGRITNESNIPISGATVALGGAASGSIVTDANGNYRFSGLANGSYTVTPGLTDFIFVPQIRNITIENSDARAINFIAIPAAQMSFSISGTITDAGGAALAGVAVALSERSIATTITDADGKYEFAGLPNGRYTITPELTGRTFSPTSQTVAIENANITSIDFTGTLIAQTFSISGNIADASQADTAGVTLTLNGDASATTQTDAQGNYSFTGLANGNYTVTPSMAGFTFTPSSQGVMVNGADITGIDFVAVPPVQVFDISGNISEAGVGNLSGVTVTLSGATTASATTDVAGNYSFSGLESGSYSVTPGLADYTFSPASQEVTLDNANVNNIDFVASPVPAATFSLSGQITESPGAAVSGVTLILSGDANSTTVTDAGGNYMFNALENGSYTVTPVLTGFTFDPVNRDVTIADADITAVDFTATPPVVKYAISGNISDAVPASVEGVTVTLAGDATASTTTDVNGNYIFSELLDGSYTVTPSLTDFTFTPTGQSVTINGADVTGIDFVAIPPVITFSISGTIADSSPAAAQGVVVTLGGDSVATTTTDQDGNYSFIGLANGNYTITPSFSDFSFTPASQTVTVNNADVSSIDFVAVPPVLTYSISGTIVDASPAAMEGVTVTLSGNSTASTTTDVNGNYSFSGLSDGDYTVTASMFDRIFTPTNRGVTINGADVSGMDFSGADATPGLSNISGHILDADGAAVIGLTVTLRGAVAVNTTTNADGMFRFLLLANGDYTISPSSDIYSFEPVDRPVTVNDADVNAVDFVASSLGATFSISGNIADASIQNISGVTVTLTGAGSATTTTDASGNYTFNGLSNGQFTITPTDANYAFNPVSQDVTISNVDISAINFVATAVNTFSISGNIAEAGGANVSGVTVNLSGASTAAAVTDVAGNYTFSGLSNGNYTVSPVSATYSFAPLTQAVSVSNADVPGINFAATATVLTFTISGNVSDATGAVAGATLVLSGDTDIVVASDAAGNYSFSNIAPGVYTILPSKTGMDFTPASQAVTVTSADMANIDFAASVQAAGTHNHTLFISSGALSVNGAGGANIPAWGFSNTADAPEFPGPPMLASEGDTLNITVINTHNIAHNFSVVGISTAAAAIPPNTSRTYSLTLDTAGTYLYHDSLNDNINREMGMYGAIVVGPSDGSNNVWTGGPAFDLQRTWVLGDMDKSRWNDVASSGGAVNTAVYKPNYFLINGMGGFDAMHDLGNTVVDGTVGQTALIRIVNGGQFSQTLHFHGNHVQVVSKNGTRQAAPYKLRDVVTVPPLGTMQVLFVMNQPGEYPMHNHTAQMETANGVYLNGVATMIIMQ